MYVDIYALFLYTICMNAQPYSSELLLFSAVAEKYISMLLELFALIGENNSAVVVILVEF